MLVATAEGRVRARGGRAVMMHVAEDNEAARRLYVRLGYRETGRRPRPDGTAEPVLLRDLGTAPVPG
ncbi:GNAT family N-acetyltransferase [Georgenia sp. 311]|uniref:GNAT family N-acetyltransferase n=1 Tax=Georgenia wutianyii TaxID=2585135 RepID=A0ABX5VQL1_9MICO|nr:GNAT family N-acetyltransferase [Georgenia wutianyii]TNC18239.1 GNAT family N-acetyltransferase [Georgenia sp. 311]